MKSTPNRNIGIPKLKFGLVSAVICSIVAVWLMNVGPTRPVVTTTPSSGLQTAPTARVSATGPTSMQENGSRFPPRSDLTSGLARASGGEAAFVSGDGMLGTQPSGAQMLGEPPSSAGTPGDRSWTSARAHEAPVEGPMRREPQASTREMSTESQKSGGVLGTRVDGQMRGQRPSFEGRMDTDSPNSVESLGTSTEVQMRGEPPSLAGKIGTVLPNPTEMRGTEVRLGTPGRATQPSPTAPSQRQIGN